MLELLCPLPPPLAPDIALYFFLSLSLTVWKVADWGLLGKQRLRDRIETKPCNHVKVLPLLSTRTLLSPASCRGGPIRESSVINPLPIYQKNHEFQLFIVKRMQC